MSGYTKLFNSILASTVWSEDNETRIVWITLLAMADRHGIVEGSVPGIAAFARVDVEACRHSLNRLQQPDKDSRSEEFGGRRIEAVDGGYLVLNHAKYRAKLGADERREYFRERKRAQRQKSKTVQDKSQLSHIAEAEAEAEAEADQKQDQDQRASARDSLRVLIRLAHDAYRTCPDDPKNELKTLAAKAGIPYQSGVIDQALDAAERQRS